MTQSIDPIKLRAAAEHLEWVLKQYPNVDALQSLLHSLFTILETAKTGNLRETMDRMDIPGAYNFSDGRYTSYVNPNVEVAYSDFITEMRGGLTDEDKHRFARIDAMRKTTPINQNNSSKGTIS